MRLVGVGVVGVVVVGRLVWWWSVGVGVGVCLDLLGKPSLVNTSRPAGHRAAGREGYTVRQGGTGGGYLGGGWCRYWVLGGGYPGMVSQGITVGKTVGNEARHGQDMARTWPGHGLGMSWPCPGHGWLSSRPVCRNRH